MSHGIASNQDKLAYCKLGERHEKQWVLDYFDSGITTLLNPAKRENQFTHDFFVMFPCDLKVQQEPFRTADRYGVDPKYAITINKKDIERYKAKYPHIIIIIRVCYPEYQASHYASLHYLKLLISRGKAKLHTYQQRVNDTQGNAKDSYVFDARWLPKIRGLK